MRKKKMTKVYVVTDGEYDYYHIVAIFSNKDKAEDFLSKYNFSECHDAEIEVYELDKYDFDIVKPVIRVRIDLERNEISETKKLVGNVFCLNIHHSDLFKTLEIDVYSDDEKEAIKIAKEKWLKWKKNRIVKE